MSERGALRVRSLSVSVRARRLLNDVSFEAAPGEVLCVVGPNGAGKSTLLNALVGLSLPSEGSITLNRLLSQFADFAAVFAFLPDGGELPAEATVQTLTEHALAGARRADPLVAKLQTALAINALLKQPAGTLSRGERQRVQLFCTLVQDKPVVVLDEPFGTFDPLQLRNVLEAVNEVAASGAIVVAAVHQLADAEKVADRILILDGGRCLAFGPLASLREESGLEGATLEAIFLALLATRKTDAA